jgi:hypothetical protein
MLLGQRNLDDNVVAIVRLRLACLPPLWLSGESLFGS